MFTARNIRTTIDHMNRSVLGAGAGLCFLGFWPGMSRLSGCGKIKNRHNNVCLSNNLKQQPSLLKMAEPPKTQPGNQSESQSGNKPEQEEAKDMDALLGQILPLAFESAKQF